MILKRISFNFKPNATALALFFLAFTQVPSAFNNSLMLSCVLTTWADYATFWKWRDIPIDERVRFCNGGDKTQNALESESIEIK